MLQKKRKSLHTYLKEMYTEQNMVPIYFRVELTLFRIQDFQPLTAILLSHGYRYRVAAAAAATPVSQPANSRMGYQASKQASSNSKECRWSSRHTYIFSKKRVTAYILIRYVHGAYLGTYLFSSRIDTLPHLGFLVTHCQLFSAMGIGIEQQQQLLQPASQLTGGWGSKQASKQQF